MKNFLRLCAALLSIAIVAACVGLCTKDHAEAATRPEQQQQSAAAAQQANMSAMPGSDESDSHYGPSF